MLEVATNEYVVYTAGRYLVGLVLGICGAAGCDLSTYYISLARRRTGIRRVMVNTENTENKLKTLKTD